MKGSILKWMGGKHAMVYKLLPMIPEHQGYVEAFGGAGHLLFGKEPSRWEVLNDIDGDLMNFWRVVKSDKEALIDSFEYTLVSRELFDEYKRIYRTGEYASDMQRAHVFYYLDRSCFGARMTSPTFGTGRARNGLKIENIEQDINRAYERLRSVVIECKDFRSIVGTYDGSSTFFFFDPPYRKTAGYNTGSFTDEDYTALSNVCAKLQGKFILTLNDDTLLRELFQGFYIRGHDVRYTVNRHSNSMRQPELIITNYEHHISQAVSP